MAGRKEPWTEERIRALGARTDIATACAVLGISERYGRELMRAGKFPVPIVELGARKHFVPTAAILRLMHLDHEPATA